MVSRGPLSCPPDGLAKPSVRSNTDTSPLSPRGDSPLRTNLWIGPNQPQVDYPCEAQATDFSRGFLIENLALLSGLSPLVTRQKQKTSSLGRLRGLSGGNGRRSY